VGEAGSAAAGELTMATIAVKSDESSGETARAGLRPSLILGTDWCRF
jgi:hypothetical protein